MFMFDMRHKCNSTNMQNMPLTNLSDYIKSTFQSPFRSNHSLCDTSNIYLKKKFKRYQICPVKENLNMFVTHLMTL